MSIALAITLRSIGFLKDWQRWLFHQPASLRLDDLTATIVRQLRDSGEKTLTIAPEPGRIACSRHQTRR